MKDLKSISAFGPCKMHSKVYEHSWMGGAPFFWDEKKQRMDLKLFSHPWWWIKGWVIGWGLVGLPYAFFFARHFLYLLFFGKSPDKMPPFLVFCYCAAAVFISGACSPYLLIVFRFDEIIFFQKDVKILLRELSKIGTSVFLFLISFLQFHVFVSS